MPDKDFERLMLSVDGIHTKLDKVKDDLGSANVAIARLEEKAHTPTECPLGAEVQKSMERHEKNHASMNAVAGLSLRRVGLGIGITGLVLSAIFGVIKLIAG